jgi:hypothetical protein
MDNLIVRAKAQVNKVITNSALRPKEVRMERAGLLKARQLVGFSPKYLVFILNS